MIRIRTNNKLVRILVGKINLNCIQFKNKSTIESQPQYYTSSIIRMPPITTSDSADGTVNTVGETKNRSNSPRLLRISVDGNISSGKSTLVSTLADVFSKEINYQVEIVQEPLEKWTNLHGFNLLDMLYKDVTKYNFMFQHYVQLTRLMDIIKTNEDESQDYKGFTGKVCIMERSLQNNRYCFNELARRQGTLHDAEFSVLAEWYKWLGQRVDLSLDLIIYLRTTPDTVYNRMKGRGRAEEATVPFEYLSSLHDTYEDWLINHKIEEEASNHPQYRKSEIIVIDANQSKTQVAEQCRVLVQEFINKELRIENDKIEPTEDKQC